MKAEVVKLLTAMAKWQQRSGEPRKAGAYLRAASAIEKRPDFEDLYARKALRTIPGIGESIERSVVDFVEHRKVPEWLGELDASAEDDAAVLPKVPASYRKAPFPEAPDLHCHTTWSDGTLTLEEVVRFARDMGAQAIGISDHSGSLGIARGLKPDEVRAQWAEIERLQGEHPDILILKGTECDILRDGSLDHPEEILQGFDYVIGSLHSALRLDTEEQTARVLRALDCPYLTTLGHPTTAVPNRRASANLDFDRVFEKAAARGVALEVNGNPGRLDLPVDLARKALSMGCKLALGSDAHSAWEMLSLETARRMAAEAGATQADLVNYTLFEAES